MDDYRFSVVIGRNGDGWVAVCPEFQGCEVHGKSYEEALANIRGAIQVRDRGLPRRQRRYPPGRNRQLHDAPAEPVA